MYMVHIRCEYFTRDVPNILFIFHSVQIVGLIVYLYSAELGGLNTDSECEAELC